MSDSCSAGTVTIWEGRPATGQQQVSLQPSSQAPTEVGKCRAYPTASIEHDLPVVVDLLGDPSTHVPLCLIRHPNPSVRPNQRFKQSVHRKLTHTNSSNNPYFFAI